ncbi:MAG: bacteriohopanetetrol glucosamine biosynthesis glycosyltransferase HpnI [Candidatus Tectomicrobia bacterium]|uniref:Bacteriohopanetetrol glucosamine biosynthesis glycosyltransferase HpnI n=1 Tax=Tectimicrobiota bacterium TaxID=2528274 RepID=A0A932FV42_UNCTE|nr:bacteriohopanetetrol glucosamine biosynthesis glycosyltransferase HpnI [Candidatus Tectomicrobia bacterium]
MIVIQLLLAFCIGASLLYYLFSLYCVARLFQPDPGEERAEELPPASILKPVKGAEPGISQNFHSLCCQDYPTYQIHFGTVTPEDPAIPVIERVRDRCPGREIGLHVVGRGDGANEKVWILRNLLGKAQEELLVINDADIRVGPDYLRRILPPLKDPEVGLVTTPYRAIEAQGKGIYATLTALYVNADFFPSVAVASRLQRIDFGLGATLATKRQVLARIGGLEALADLLADDFYLGHKIDRAGYQVRLVPYLVDTVIPRQGARDFFHQQLRWARTLRSCRPWGYFWSGITHGVTASTLWLLLSRFSHGGWLLFALTLLVRLLTTWGITSHYLRLPRAAHDLWLLPLRDWLGTFFWLGSFLGNRVTWRGRRFILDREGRIHGSGTGDPIPDPRSGRHNGSAGSPDPG